MPRLTSSQIKCMIPAQAALERREIVLLKGGSNGKTRIAKEMQEAMGYQDSMGRYRTKAHPENPTVEFVDIMVPGYQSTHEGYFQREILREMKGDAPYRLDQVQVNFRLLLKETYPHVICVVIDNAETMPGKAFGIIKELNEKRDSVIVRETKERRWIGCAFLLAGHYHKLKAELSFYRHATEISVGKIERAEIRELIEIRYPAEAMHFTEAALERLAQLETTNDLHACVRGAIQLRRENRAKTIEEKIIANAYKALTQRHELVPSLANH